MNKKDLILLAKEVYPELFGKKQKEIQEQIMQLMEPISCDEPDGDPKVDIEAIVNKLNQQNAALVKVLKDVYDDIGRDPDIYWKGDLLEQIEIVLAKVEGNDDKTNKN